MLFNLLLNKVAEKKFEHEKAHLFNVQKKLLKNEIDSVILGIEQLRNIGYSLAYTEIEKLTDLIIKQKPYNVMGLKLFLKKHLTDDLFYWYKSINFTYPEGIKESYIKVANKTYKIIIYNNRKYLVTSAKIKNGRFGIAFSLDIVRNTIKQNIFKFLDEINKNKISYIAMGKITTWHPDKNGTFGEIIYMPGKLKKLVGKKLSLEKPDIKGNYYRKEYFDAFKNESNELFLKYYFKNPKTDKYELKISYFKIYRPYDWVLVKGFYYSQIEDIIAKNKKAILNNVKNVFILTAIILFIVSLVNFVIAYFISKKIMNQIIREYETLKENYEESQKELIKRVYFDSLTLLPNRAKLLEEIKKFESVCLIDIDDFSDLNDIYGFDTGDEILKKVAYCLKEKYKSVYRIGSDEFAITFPYKISEREIKDLVNTNFNYNEIKITFSVGVSYLKEKLFETAETALKLALKDNSLKYKIYDEKMQKKQIERLEKIQQLTRILESQNIVPYYQCIVDKEGNVVKYEALMRIKLNDEILSPFQFMEFIKEAKLYNKFSRIMIKKVFEDVYKLNKPVSINLSFIDIANRETKKFIIDLLEQNRSANIVFEILETENIEQFDTVIDFIMKVKKYGVKIAIDDFGTGYSNLVNILYLKPDYLKIDASLVKNIDNPMYKEIINFIVAFAKKFSIKTTAEFVSDEYKYEILAKIGIDEFQGFYFCEPQPIEKLI
jgi:diguanylate cyclase (GGDEF)-like protein